MMRLVHEYDRVLKPAFRSCLIYTQGKLAMERHQLFAAETLFTRALSDVPPPSLDLQVRTMMRLGLIDAERRRWREAISKYEHALSLASLTETPYESRALVS